MLYTLIVGEGPFSYAKDMLDLLNAHIRDNPKPPSRVAKQVVAPDLDMAVLKEDFSLEQYLNAGGRALASHYHYTWFAGPLSSGQTYAAPTDWGANLATWAANGTTTTGVIGGTLVETLNGSTATFPKGAVFKTWLTENAALGTDGVVPGELAIYEPRYNATVGPTNKPSQAWITADATSGSPGATMHFSFDTPVNAAIPPGGTTPAYCGRAAFSDLHVGGNPLTNDAASSPPPARCSTGNLSPQEMALEFMLFDLSACVAADTASPP